MRSKHIELKCSRCTVKGIRWEVDMIPHWPLLCPVCHNPLEEEEGDVIRYDSRRTEDYEHGDEG